MNKFLDLVKQRQSIRRYDPGPIEKDKLFRCLEAARLSPSASNSQPWTFLVVDDPVLKEKVARETYDPIISFNKFTHQAPVIIVLVIEKPKLVTRIGGALKKREFPLIDIGIAAEHLCLQATEEGLGTCMLGWFNEKSIRRLLNIDRDKTIGLLISIGYPEKGYKIREKTRKPFYEVMRRNSYLADGRELFCPED